jgi:hypothetical protein
MVTRCFHANLAGDFSTAAALADEGLELALREGSPSVIARLHTMQLITCYPRGDLAGAENHFAAEKKFIDDAVFRQYPGGVISVFGWASCNAWILGRADVARERLAKMRATVNPANPHDLPWSHVLGARLFALMRENETVETLAASALDLCEKHGFPTDAAISRCLLGRARAQLGRAADGIALISGGIDTLVQVGNRIYIPKYMTYLADAHHRAGALGDSLETVEQALNFNPVAVVDRPETLRICGVLRFKQGDLQLAEADFPRGDRPFASDEREVMGTAHHHEPRSIASRQRSSRGSAHDARRDLRLVHRGLRHSGPERRQVPIGRVRNIGCAVP